MHLLSLGDGKPNIKLKSQEHEPLMSGLMPIFLF